MGGFTAALQAAHHDDARRLGRELNPGIFIAHKVAQFFVDNLNDLLCRSQAGKYLFPNGTF